MAAILRDFGQRTRQQDPVIHFYETFLHAYDPVVRETRGVYYTPQPVVSYIVRSLDHLLRAEFGCAAGLAESALIARPNTDPALTVKGSAGKAPRKTAPCHRVLILDPACGTGTFLQSVIAHIHDTLAAQGQQGAWSSYVSEHLLPRLHGFELLMAPYAVAHLKLGLQLRELGYDFQANERLRVYLTNTLEEPHEWAGLPLFTQELAREVQAANEGKRDLPIMVILGNPPYSGHSANKGQWINNLLRSQGEGAEGLPPSYFLVDGKP